MDKYARRRQQEQDKILDNEIRLSKISSISRNVELAYDKFKNHQSICLRAAGQAIPKAVQLAEVLRRRIKGLHQNTSIQKVEIEDVYDPIEEGLDQIKIKKNLSILLIELSKNQLDPQLPGYQAPLPDEQVQELTEQQMKERQYMSYRGGQGQYFQRKNEEGQNERQDGRFQRRSFRRGRGRFQGERGRGRFQGGEGGRGRGRFQGGNFQGQRGYGNPRGQRGYGPSRAQRGRYPQRLES